MKINLGETSERAISDIQWLAGTLYEADATGEVTYNGNAAIIAANGMFRVQGEGVDPHLQTHETGLYDGGALVYDPSQDMGSSAWRFAKVTRDLSAVERKLARLWLVDHAAPARLSDFKGLLDKLVSIYSTHDEQFAFDAWQHNATTFGSRVLEATNENDGQRPNAAKRKRVRRTRSR